MQVYEPPVQLLTVGTIAEEIGQPIHRVARVINTRGIREAARVGTLRVFSRDALNRIKAEIEMIDRRKAVPA